MIKCEIFLRKDYSAILTAIIISIENVSALEGVPPSPPALDILPNTNNRRKPKAFRYGMDAYVVMLNHIHFFRKPQKHGPLPTYHLHRLVAGVEHQNSPSIQGTWSSRCHLINIVAKEKNKS